MAPRSEFKTSSLKITIYYKEEHSPVCLDDSTCSLGMGYEYAHVHVCAGASTRLDRSYTRKQHAILADL